MAKEYIQQKSYWQDEDGNEHDNISEEGYKENGVKCGEWKYYYLRIMKCKEFKTTGIITKKRKGISKDSLSLILTIKV